MPANAFMRYMRLCCLFYILPFVLPLQVFSQINPRGMGTTTITVPPIEELYENSYAVIIGINNYEKWPNLEYAVNDAKSMARKLTDLGFQTSTLIDQQATRDNIIKLLGDELPRKIRKNDRVLIFFAGHGQTEELADGTQIGYVIPVDGDTRNIYSSAISMDQLRILSRRLIAKHVLYLMDSCYAGLGLTRSGALPSTDTDYLQKNTLRKAHQMLTAGGKGEQAHEEGKHGIFTKFVLEALDGSADRDSKGYVTFTDLASYVKPKVSRFTRNMQIPQYGTIEGEGEFVFILPVKNVLNPPGQISAIDSDVLPPKKITKSTESVIEESLIDPATGMEFVFVKGGCFSMGDTFDEGDRDEKPVHEVCVNNFYMGKYEVTQGQWEKIMGNNPSRFSHGMHYPVEEVGWNDANAFIEKLNKKSRRHYRLPTEAEWEFAARSGGKEEKYAGTSLDNALVDYAWYDINAGAGTRPVGQKKPNGLGLYDMSGNVWEWCQDYYEETYYQRSIKHNPTGMKGNEYRVIRGGAWNYRANQLRTANRSRSKPADRFQGGNGLRLVLPIN